MWSYNYPSYLEHHGTLGMKWGRRNGPPYPLNPSDRSAAEKRANSSLGSATNSNKKKNAIQKAAEILGGKKSKKVKRDAAKSQHGETKRTVKDLSDSELREHIQRLELEMKYSDLMRRMNPKKESRAKKVVYNILERTATDLGTQVVKSLGAEAINKAFGRDIVNFGNNKDKTDSDDKKKDKDKTDSDDKKKDKDKT